MNELHRVAATDLNLLVILDVLLRTRSTTDAARRLGRTQSAVSHALARLRAALGDPLFVRAGARLQPTPAAEALQAPVRELLVRAEAVLGGATATFAPASLERRFVVGCADYAEIVVLPRLVPALRVEAPGVDVTTRFVGDEIDRVVQAREVDLAFGASFRALSGVVTEPVIEEPMVLLLRRGHPALRRRLGAARYAALDHVLVTPRGLPGSAVDRALEPLGLTRRVVVRLPHFTAAAALVALTDLAVTMPAGLAARLGDRLGLAVRPLPFAMPEVSFGIAYPAACAPDPGHRWFRERFVAAARAR